MYRLRLQGRLDDIHVVDDTQCRFNVNSFKMVYVVNRESCLYKRNALVKARQVSQSADADVWTCTPDG